MLHVARLWNSFRLVVLSRSVCSSLIRVVVNTY